MLEALNIDVIFNPKSPLENHALKDISLTISEGEFVTVIGTNGAGKSTLLNVFSGDLSPQLGSVLIDGKVVTNLSSARRAPFLGRVFQDPKAGTCENLTIEENLAIAARRVGRRTLRWSIGKKERGEWRARLSQLGMGLENRLTDEVGLLSGGQRQALSLLMACLVSNKALLLDEHTAALDPHAAAKVLELTDLFAATDKLTVLMVTHSMRQALEHGSRTIMLHEGQIILDVSGKQRDQLEVSDLLKMFETARGETIDDDSLVLG